MVSNPNKVGGTSLLSGGTSEEGIVRSLVQPSCAPMVSRNGCAHFKLGDGMVCVTLPCKTITKFRNKEGEDLKHTHGCAHFKLGEGMLCVTLPQKTITKCRKSCSLHATSPTSNQATPKLAKNTIPLIVRLGLPPQIRLPT